MQPSPAADNGEHLVLLRDVLEAIAREMELIGDLGDRTQAALSPLLAQVGSSVPEVQNLDLLVQHASGLAAFTRELVKRCPVAWEQSPAAAAAGLPMHAQRRRLSCQREASVKPVPLGEAEFF